MSELALGALPERVVRHSAAYALARVLVGALDILLLPLYTRLLTPGEFGLVALGTALIAALGLLYPLGLDAALSRFFFDHQTGSTPQRRSVGTILLGITGLGFTAAIICSLLGPGPAGGVLAGVSPRFFRLIVWTAFFNLFAPLWLQLLQVRQEPRRYLTYALLQGGLRAALTLTAVAGLGRGAEGWAEAYLLSAVGAALIVVPRLREGASPVVDGQVLRDALTYGLPLLVHQLAAWAAVYAGRLVLNQLVSLSAVGIYQVAFSIGQALGLATTAVNFAYAPFFMRMAVQSPTVAATTFSGFASRYVAALIGVAVVLSLFAKEIVAAVAPAGFSRAAPLVPIMLASVVTQGFYYLLSNPILFHKRSTRYLPLVTVAGGAASLAGNYLLVPRLGIAGAAWAGLLASIVVVLGAYPLAQRALPMRYQVGRIVGAALFGAALVLCSQALAARPLPAGVPVLVNLALAGVFVSALAYLNLLNRDLLRVATSLFAGRP